MGLSCSKGQYSSSNRSSRQHSTSSINGSSNNSYENNSSMFSNNYHHKRGLNRHKKTKVIVENKGEGKTSQNNSTHADNNKNIQNASIEQQQQQPMHYERVHNIKENKNRVRYIHHTDTQPYMYEVEHQSNDNRTNQNGLYTITEETGNNLNLNNDTDAPITTVSLPCITWEYLHVVSTNMPSTYNTDPVYREHMWSLLLWVFKMYPCQGCGRPIKHATQSLKRAFQKKITTRYDWVRFLFDLHNIWNAHKLSYNHHHHPTQHNQEHQPNNGEKETNMFTWNMFLAKYNYTPQIEEVRKSMGMTVSGDVVDDSRYRPLLTVQKLEGTIGSNSQPVLHVTAQLATVNTNDVNDANENIAPTPVPAAVRRLRESGFQTKKYGTHINIKNNIQNNTSHNRHGDVQPCPCEATRICVPVCDPVFSMNHDVCEEDCDKRHFNNDGTADTYCNQIMSSQQNQASQTSNTNSCTVAHDMEEKSKQLSQTIKSLLKSNGDDNHATSSQSSSVYPSPATSTKYNESYNSSSNNSNSKQSSRYVTPERDANTPTTPTPYMSPRQTVLMQQQKQQKKVSQVMGLQKVESCV